MAPDALAAVVHFLRNPKDYNIPLSLLRIKERQDECARIHLSVHLRTLKYPASLMLLFLWTPMMLMSCGDVKGQKSGLMYLGFNRGMLVGVPGIPPGPPTTAGGRIQNLGRQCGFGSVWDDKVALFREALLSLLRHGGALKHARPYLKVVVTAAAIATS